MRGVTLGLLVGMAMGCGGKDADSGIPTGPGNTTTPTGTGGTGVAVLNGAWRIAELELVTGTSVEGEDHMGAVMITTAGDSGSMRVHQAQVDDGLMSEEVNVEVWSFTIDGMALILTSENATQVFVVSGQDDERLLVWDAADPRNDVPATLDVASQIRLERLDPPSVEGSWSGVSFSQGPYLTLLDQCVPNGPSAWQTSTLVLTVDVAGVLTLETTNALYSDDQCTAPLGAVDSWTGLGFWRDRTSPVSEMWISGPDSSSWDEQDVTIAGQDLTLDRLNCRPVPDCEGEGFDTVNFVRTTP